MAWADGIFKKFLRYWTKKERTKEERPSFWEEAIQRKEIPEKQRQEMRDNKEIKHIFYIKQEKMDSKAEKTGKVVPIFQNKVLPIRDIDQCLGRTIFLQKEIPVLQREKRAKRTVEKEQTAHTVPAFSTRTERIFSLSDKGEKEEIREKQEVFQEAKRTMPQMETFSSERKNKSVFGLGERDEVAVRKETGKSPIVQEMEREYRSEELLQQIVQYAGQNTQETKQPKISVQIGQVQKSTDVDTIITEITRKLWEARSMGRCSVEGR